MGSENTTTNNEELNQNHELQYDSEGLGVSRKQPFRQRLNSDPQDYPSDNEKLRPIRRYSLKNNSNDFMSSNLRNSLGAVSPKNKDSNLNSLNDRSYKRKLSQQYCQNFKKIYSNDGPNRFLNHLAVSLNKEQENEEPDFERIRKLYLPEYLFDWRYVEDPKSGVKYWKNFGKIIIDIKMFEKIRKLAKSPIGASEPFYLKRSWLFSYIRHRFGKIGSENPIINVNRNNIFIDSFNQFIRTQGLNLSKPLKIRFINEKV